jgi:hypothetical protein
MLRVMYRPRKSAPWESCYLVAGGRQRAIASARQIANQEVVLGGRGQAGIMKENSRKVTIIKADAAEQKKEGN